MLEGFLLETIQLITDNVVVSTKNKRSVGYVGMKTAKALEGVSIVTNSTAKMR